MSRRFAITMSLMAALVIPAGAQQKQQIGPVVAEGFSTLTITKDEVTLSGPQVHVRTTDGKFEAKAREMVIRFGQGGPQTAVGSLQSAKLTGDAYMLSKAEPERSTKAWADSADIDWAGRRLAVLSGNVRIESEDPTMFKGPFKATADRAIVSLKPASELQPGETRIRIESDPGKSRLEFTPLPPKQPEKAKSAH